LDVLRRDDAAAGATWLGAKTAAVRAPGPRYLVLCAALDAPRRDDAAAGATWLGAKTAAVRAPEPRYF
jgi:hypothetical protein